MRAVPETDITPPLYEPWSGGVYTVAAGLEPLERPGPHRGWDSRVLQIGSDASRFRKNYEAARVDDLSKYHALAGLAPEAEKAIHRFVAQTMCVEYPDRFHAESTQNGTQLHAMERGETLDFGPGFEWRGNSECYVSGLDALVSQVPEDLAVVQTDKEGDRLAAVHVCAPSHWDPREKLGRSFVEIHEPVAGIEKVNAKGPALMRAIAKGGAYRRLGWSLTVDDRLNHHPVPPRGFPGTPTAWHGKRFDPAAPRLFARVERQVLIGLPEHALVLFFIRVYTYNVEQLSITSRRALRAALRSMSPAAIAYKGIEDSVAAIDAWLAEREA
jgi:dimethylamine monooxygenase subunit A